VAGTSQSAAKSGNVGAGGRHLLAQAFDFGAQVGKLGPVALNLGLSFPAFFLGCLFCIGLLPQSQHVSRDMFAPQTQPVG
jgi:hypothetical protein